MVWSAQIACDSLCFISLKHLHMLTCRFVVISQKTVALYLCLEHLYCLKANKKEEYFHLGLHSLVHIATCNYAQCIFLRPWPYISLQKLLLFFPKRRILHFFLSCTWTLDKKSFLKHITLFKFHLRISTGFQFCNRLPALYPAHFVRCNLRTEVGCITVCLKGRVMNSGPEAVRMLGASCF